jgi:hypothetical protein
MILYLKTRACTFVSFFCAESLFGKLVYSAQTTWHQHHQRVLKKCICESLLEGIQTEELWQCLDISVHVKLAEMRYPFGLIVAVLVQREATIGCYDHSPSRRRCSFSDSASDSAATISSLTIEHRSCFRTVEDSHVQSLN